MLYVSLVHCNGTRFWGMHAKCTHGRKIKRPSWIRGCMFCLLYRQFFVSSTDKLHLRVVCYVSSTDKLHLYVICYVSSTDELNPYVMSSLQMNSTRMLWTHKLNCTHRENDHNALPVVAISCVVACTPILFYVSLRVTSKVGHKKIFKRKFVLICCIWSIFFLCLQIPILKQI